MSAAFTRSCSCSTMATPEDRRQRRACGLLADQPADFEAILFALQDLYDLADRQPEEIRRTTLKALTALLLSRRYDRQRQRLFIFRQAASVLALLMTKARRAPVGQAAWKALLDVLGQGRDLALRAAAESLGMLPAAVDPAPLLDLPPITGTDMSWSQLLALAGFRPEDKVKALGRTLVVAGAKTSNVLAVKFARRPAEGRALQIEAGWMTHLNRNPPQTALRCDIPSPLTHQNGWVFNIKDAPGGSPARRRTDSQVLAMAYLVSPDYFSYPNPADPAILPAPAGFAEMIQRSAFLLGFFAARGMGHRAPIPLFHNRVQQERRRDGGLYEWFRAGRLDRWLASCAYPNFGLSGIRDFEHLAPVSGKGGSLQLYRLIGQHLLSLLLVVGSYFRARDPQRMGLDAGGAPVDARDLFDLPLMQTWIEAIFKNYYHGFAGEGLDLPLPVDSGAMTHRMVEEMGVDRHMDEILRTTDQRQMSAAQFTAFLIDRGYSPAAVQGVAQGKEDLVLQTGPHLGAFNRGISLPEMIEAVAAMAALCVAGRFRRFH